jgi:hypothetical protein
MPFEVVTPFVMDMNAARIFAPWTAGAVLLEVNHKVHRRGGRKRLFALRPVTRQPESNLTCLRPRPLHVRPSSGVEKVLGLAFRGHKLYALEMSTSAGGPTPGTGAIVRVRRHGPPVTIVSGLTFPTGMTVGPDGAFYVSNQGFGFQAGEGQVLRITP